MTWTSTRSTGLELIELATDIWVSPRHIRAIEPREIRRGDGCGAYAPETHTLLTLEHGAQIEVPRPVLEVIKKLQVWAKKESPGPSIPID